MGCSLNTPQRDGGFGQSFPEPDPPEPDPLEPEPLEPEPLEPDPELEPESSDPPGPRLPPWSSTVVGGEPGAVVAAVAGPVGADVVEVVRPLEAVVGSFGVVGDGTESTVTGDRWAGGTRMSDPLSRPVAANATPTRSTIVAVPIATNPA